MTGTRSFSFTPDELQEMLVAGARRFALEADSFEARRIGAENQRATIWDHLVEMGWSGIAVPETAGGFGGRAEEIALLLLNCGTGLAAPMLVGNIVLPSFLLGHGNEDSARVLLGDLAAGKRVIAVANLEADGADWTAIRSVAKPVDTGFAITGRKRMILAGELPDTFIVSASLGGGTGLFRVERDLAGVISDTQVLVDGSVMMSLDLGEVHLAPDALLVPPGDAEEAIRCAVDHTLLAISAVGIACMDRALLLSADYLKVRNQFGKSLSEFQALQHRVADLFIHTEDARSILYAAIAASGADARQRGRMASACKAKVLSLAERVTGEAVHLHGGIGFTREYEVGHLFQRAVVGARLLGTADDHMTRYAKLRR
jgi:alkylation response protein AidB-like acyl-CoA dehydrogenase